MENPNPSIESQIDFLKECYDVAIQGYVKASGDPIKMGRAERATSHLAATIKLLESIQNEEA